MIQGQHNSQDAHQDPSSGKPFPTGCGEMSERIRQFDWSATSIGPIESWPDELRMATSLILASVFPMAILWGKELIFIYNDGYRLMINHKHPSAIGKSNQEIWPEAWSFNEPIFNKVLNFGETVYFEDQLFRINRHWPSEETYFTLCYSPIRLENHSVGGALVVLQETTRYVLSERRQRESEQVLRNIIDSTPSHIFAFDTQNRFTLVNKALADYCHLTKEYIQGKSLQEIFPEPVASRLEQANNEIMSTGITRYFEEEVESQATRKKNQVMTSKFPVKDDAGKIIGMGGVATDITERKRLEEELIEEKIKAENLANLKSKFLDTAAHELRTPVTIILLLVDMFQKCLDRGQMIDDSKLKQLREATSRLKSLINDLLDVSRLERGLITLQIEKLNLNQIISKCIDDFLILDPKRKIEFLPTLSPVEISLDRIRIMQVLSNLLDNAIKYTPDSTPIEVRLEASIEKVTISVIDHGPGIAQEALTNLFQAFSRGNSPFTIKASGLGLGLSVSKGIIELHGGHIGVKSKLGKGSTFYFDLPKQNCPT